MFSEVSNHPKAHTHHPGGGTRFGLPLAGQQPDNVSNLIVGKDKTTWLAFVTPEGELHLNSTCVTDPAQCIAYLADDGVSLIPPTLFLFNGVYYCVYQKANQLLAVSWTNAGPGDPICLLPPA